MQPSIKADNRFSHHEELTPNSHTFLLSTTKNNKIDTFTLFPQLALEVRNIIWGYASCSTQPRFITFSHLPVNLCTSCTFIHNTYSPANNEYILKYRKRAIHQVNQESRAAAMKANDAFVYIENTFKTSGNITKLQFNQCDILWLPNPIASAMRLLVPSTAVQQAPGAHFSEGIRTIALSDRVIEMLTKRGPGGQRRLSNVLVSFPDLTMVWVLLWTEKGIDISEEDLEKCVEVTDLDVSRIAIARGPQGRPSLKEVEMLRKLLDRYTGGILRLKS